MNLETAKMKLWETTEALRRIEEQVRLSRKKLEKESNVNQNNEKKLIKNTSGLMNEKDHTMFVKDNVHKTIKKDRIHNKLPVI